MRICNIPYPCPICGKPRKLRYSSSRNRQINQLTGDYFYKTCGKKQCVSKLVGKKSHYANEAQKESLPKLYKGLWTAAVKNRKKSTQKAAKYYFGGIGKFILRENITKKQYRERKQQEANDFFEELKRKAKELNEHR